MYIHIRSLGEVNFLQQIHPNVGELYTVEAGLQSFEDQPQPYTTHPRLDEFAGGSSPHPMSEYGCTSCHAGRGRGTDFISSGHMPKDEIQAKEWKEKYGWEALHYWEDKMLPAQYVEAGCFKCHGTSVLSKASVLSSIR